MNAKQFVTVVACSVVLGITFETGAFAEILWINGGSQLYSVDSATPGTLLSGPVTYSGLTSGDGFIDGIDFDPATSVLYGFASNSGRLYTINKTSGAVSGVGTSSTTLNRFIGMTFEAPDTIRIVHRSGAQFRLSSLSGSLVATDTTVAEDGFGTVAYDAATSTTYGMDDSTGNLYRLGSLGGSPNLPSSGLVELVGASSIFTSRTYNMDISAATGVAYVTDGQGGGGGSANLYTINLSTGVGTFVGPLASPLFGSGDGIAIEPVPEPMPLLMMLIAGMSHCCTARLIRRRDKFSAIGDQSVDLCWRHN